MARTLELDVIQTPDQTGTPEISLSTGNVTIPSVTIQGGTIEDTAIGAVTPDTGKFTNVEVTGTLSGSVTVGSTETFTMASGSNLSLQSNSITTSVINDLAVTNAKIGASAVTAPKIANNAVTTAKIANSTGTDDGVTTAKLATGAVTNAKIADATIETAKIGNNQVTLDKLAANSVDASKIKNFVAADTTVTPNVAQVDAVTTAKINDGAVTNDKLASNAVTAIKIADFVAADPTATPAVAQVDGVTTAKINDNAVTTAKINGSAVTTAKINDGAVTAAKLGSGAVTTAKIDGSAVTYAKIQDVSATNRILGRDSDNAGPVEEITPAALRTMINVADGATNTAAPYYTSAIPTASLTQHGLMSNAHFQKLNSLSTTPVLLDGHAEMVYLHRYSPNPVSVAGAGSNAVYKSAHSTGEYFVPEAGWLYEIEVSFSYETDTDNTFFALSYGNDSAYSRNATVTGVHLLQNVRILDTGDKVQDGPHIGHLTLRGFVRWTSTSFTPNIYPVLSAKNTSTNNNLYVTISSSNSGNGHIFYTVKRYKNRDYTTSAGN